MQEREDAPAGGGLLVDGGGPVTRAKAREMKKSSSREQCYSLVQKRNCYCDLKYLINVSQISQYYLSKTVL